MAKSRDAPAAPGGPGRGAATLPELSETLLVTRARDGDAEAFQALLLRHQGVAHRVAVRVLGRSADPGDAEDAVQDAFISAWRRLSEFRGEASFAHWICRIVANRCLNVVRARRPTLPLEGAAELAEAGGLSPERRAEAGAALCALRAALDALTPRQRACWLLAEVHGLSYQEIATTVRSTPQAVRGRIFRARRELAEAMRAWR